MALLHNLYTVPGIILNILLLYLIKRFSAKSLGAYKYLLSIFAVYDIYLTIMHAIIDLGAVVTEHFYGVVSHNHLDTSKFTSAYGACFMTPFTLLNIHFLYRYWVIKYPYRVALFSQPPFIVFLCVCVSSVTLFWYYICEYGLDTTEEGYAEARADLARQFNRSDIDGWFVYHDELRISARTVGTILCYDVVMGVLTTSAALLALLTFRQIQAETTLTFADRHSQMRILLAVCIQTFVPFAFVYCPFLFFFNLPLVGFRLIWLAATVSPLVHSVFPALDAMVIILLMKDYRKGALLLIIGRQQRVVSIASQSGSS